MKHSINLRNISINISRFFERFHTIIFFFILGASLITCLIIIVSIINLSGQTNSSTTAINQNFDESTINRLDQLQTSNQGSYNLPSGRTNPFVE